ncbi:hypothetical protein [Nocardiopsis tropica]|uniref:Uncharacterized protein n=1 Tax=Nocardiopsis tropica TaxID=109330 RepID=A0ABU7KIF0_9ACTN|nr:hypothetical protein [Nocardiopsis umidischolae]MEE2049074.1 hypothetical protein [Nocardiopsis umidischolae]
MARYFRIHADYIGRLGTGVGLFVAVDHLRRAGRLSEAEEDLYLDIDDWFREALPTPPFYADGNTVGAVTWFKPEGCAHFTGRLDALRGLLRAHGVEHRRSESDDPGRIVYEDAHQVGAVPRTRRAPTPLPLGTVLGPTTAGSKRHLAGRAARGPGD